MPKWTHRTAESSTSLKSADRNAARRINDQFGECRSAVSLRHEPQEWAASAMLYRQSDLAARRSTASSPFPQMKHSGKILSYSEIGTDLVTSHILWSGRFPAASNQIRMTDAVQDSRFSIYNSRSSRACRMTCGSTSTPVQYFTPITPCCTSIPSPSTVLQPRSLAA